ncbi:hypothetical protein BpHYR1_001972 [Brachionus plicatilis]|uniref:Uncharacterized protein n=1 Tax=Brachionus plicatilis TaxID=10195 RepID=A0A3M7S517_BRAPC|nr:hypothetical protein BpHYR1_001972 [Brachionus plicatilis]
MGSLVNFNLEGLRIVNFLDRVRFETGLCASFFQQIIFSHSEKKIRYLKLFLHKIFGKLKFKIKIKRSKYKLKNKFFPKQLLDMSCQTKKFTWKNKIVSV